MCNEFGCGCSGGNHVVANISYNEFSKGKILFNVIKTECATNLAKGASRLLDFVTVSNLRKQRLWIFVAVKISSPDKSYQKHVDESRVSVTF
jgi:hypothetical protein